MQRGRAAGPLAKMRRYYPPHILRAICDFAWRKRLDAGRAIAGGMQRGRAAGPPCQDAAVLPAAHLARDLRSVNLRNLLRHSSTRWPVGHHAKPYAVAFRARLIRNCFGHKNERAPTGDSQVAQDGETSPQGKIVNLADRRPKPVTIEDPEPAEIESRWEALRSDDEKQEIAELEAGAPKMESVVERSASQQSGNASAR